MRRSHASHVPKALGVRQILGMRSAGKRPSRSFCRMSKRSASNSNDGLTSVTRGRSRRAARLIRWSIGFRLAGAARTGVRAISFHSFLLYVARSRSSVVHRVRCGHRSVQQMPKIDGSRRRTSTEGYPPTEVLGPLTCACKGDVTPSGLQLSPPFVIFDGWNRMAAWISHGKQGMTYSIAANIILTKSAVV